ncbi:hypothetical protein L6164_012256 [Bauhinia variegata]|uniref:Uncharacterized protein n=1 Tax=Bauhinia variegata TaxID=167791 RepID=A0ACB9P9H1_BAUVA|nr:hypothetical protein L6164_012256 [Bauhinia variegata]
MAKTKLVPGFRFHPTDVELVKYYLKRKVMGKKFSVDVIAEVDIYKYVPWDLPDKSILRTGDLEWDLTDKGIPQDSYVLCRLFKKDGPGPRNGAQYGKPFNEENWNDDDEEVDCSDSDPLVALPAPFPVLPSAHDSSIATDSQLHVSGCIVSSPLSCLSGAVPSHPSVSNVQAPPLCMMHPSDSSAQAISDDDTQVPVGDDILLMSDCFPADNTPALNENNKIEKVSNPVEENDAEGAPHLDINDIFKDLGDIDNFAGLGETGSDEFTGNQMLPLDDMPHYPDFLELHDLDSPILWQTEHYENRCPHDQGPSDQRKMDGKKD